MKESEVMQNDSCAFESLNSGSVLMHVATLTLFSWFKWITNKHAEMRMRNDICSSVSINLDLNKTVSYVIFIVASSIL